MFPLPILTYVKIGLIILLLLVCCYAGYSFESARFERYKEIQQAKIQELENEHQAAADQIRKEKDAQINDINNQLLDAVSQLRKRPSRAEDSANGQSGTGLSLSAEDAEFLEREAARADVLRSNLQACYEQYDALSK
jgi:hypothetical protein